MIRGNYSALFFKTIEHRLKGIDIFTNSILRGHIQPARYAQDSAYNRRRCNRLSGVALSWIVMRMLCKQQGSIEIVFKKISTRPQPVVFVLAVIEVCDTPAYQIIA